MSVATHLVESSAETRVDGGEEGKVLGCMVLEQNLHRV